jgi:hypothetical protein
VNWHTWGRHVCVWNGGVGVEALIPGESGVLCCAGIHGDRVQASARASRPSFQRTEYSGDRGAGYNWINRPRGNGNPWFAVFRDTGMSCIYLSIFNLYKNRIVIVICTVGIVTIVPIQNRHCRFCRLNFVKHRFQLPQRKCFLFLTIRRCSSSF